MFDFKYEAVTKLSPEDQIVVLELNRIVNETREKLSIQVLNLKENAVRETLVKLGWAPPSENPGTYVIERKLQGSRDRWEKVGEFKDFWRDGTPLTLANMSLELTRYRMTWPDRESRVRCPNGTYII